MTWVMEGFDRHGEGIAAGRNVCFRWAAGLFFPFIAALFLATPLHAEDLRPGCYYRDYSAQHLAAHPDQVVDWIKMVVEKDSYGDTVARMLVASANQGHAKLNTRGGRLFEQWLFCYKENGRTACAADCDGGRFFVTRQTRDSLTFETKYLMVGENEDCGGALDLAEIAGKSVKYRLDRVSDSACDGL